MEAENWDLVYDLLQGEDESYDADSMPMVLRVHPYFVGSHMIYRDNTGYLKSRLKDAVRDPLRDFAPGEQEYEELFHEFEILSDMVLVDQVEEVRGRKINFPSHEYWGMRVEEDIEAQGEDWGPLQAGLFDGSLDRVEEIVGRYRF